MTDPTPARMAEISQAMQRHRRRVASLRTPEERLRVALELQASCLRSLMARPESFRSFLVRNFRKRRQSEVLAQETLLRGSAQGSSRCEVQQVRLTGNRSDPEADLQRP